MINFTYIETPEQLHDASHIWNSSAELAIDLECENHLHHYGAYIALIQISDKSHHWIIDVLKLKEIKPLIHVLENPDVVKVFHDVSFDFRILLKDFHCHPRNIFDTQIAALFLGRENLGLGDMLREYLTITTEKKFQRADWTRRPLTVDMLTYAIKDTAHLLELKRKLVEELTAKQRLEWVKEECRHLDEVDFTYNEQTHLDLSGARDLSPKQLKLLHLLFDERNRLAKKADRPPFMICSNKQLLAWAVEPPHWLSLKGVHPLVRQHADQFKEMVAKAKESPGEEFPRAERKRLSDQQRQQVQELTEFRNKAADNIGIKRHLLLSQDQIITMIVEKNFDSLRPWQKKFFEKYPLN